MSKKHAPAKVPARHGAGKKKAPVTVVGNHPAHHKPAQHGAAHRARVAAAKKGAATRKHNAAVARKHRGLALGEMVSCCAAEAVAASLRLAGYSVADAEVLALYFSTASGPDDGASITATLGAAARFGLAGMRPVVQGFSLNLEYADSLFRVPCILGVELPGPHAVLATPDGAWWSWGEPWDPACWPAAVVEEAWAVTWR